MALDTNAEVEPLSTARYEEEVGMEEPCGDSEEKAVNDTLSVRV
jgi:hypothetical protein